MLLVDNITAYKGFSYFIFIIVSIDPFLFLQASFKDSLDSNVI